MNWRVDVLQEALSWDRTPYHPSGRIKQVGVDCAMLLVETYHAVGLVPKIELPDYPHDWHLHRSEEHFKLWVEKFATPLPEGQLPLMGDVVLYRFGRCYSHGAIVIDWPKVIHAVRRVGKVMIEDFGDTGEWDRPKLFYTFQRKAP